MTTPKLVRFAFLSFSLALLAGCATAKKDTAATPAVDAPAKNAAAPAAPVPATPAAVSAQPDAKAAPSVNILSRLSWLVTGLPASGAPGYDPAKAPAVAPVLKDVTIRSVPTGAAVTINGQDVGVTPLVATQLDSAKSYDVSVKLTGYLIAHTTIRKEAQLNAGPSGKSGMSGYAPAGLPSEVTIKLKATSDPYKALTAAAANLDDQFKKGKITAEQYKEKTAELARFYAPAK